MKRLVLAAFGGHRMPEELMDDSNALGYLRSEHETIEQLLASVANTAEQPDFARQAMVPLVQELQIHSAIENEFFFPFMDNYVPQDIVDRPADDNRIIDALTRKLETMNPASDEFLPTLEELHKHFKHHIYVEEQYLFLTVEGKDPVVHNELINLANVMKRRRAEMMDEMKRPRTTDFTSQPVTPGDVQQRLAQEKGRGIYPPRDVLTQQEEEALQSGGRDITEMTEGELHSSGRRRISLDHEALEQGAISEDPMNADPEGLVDRSFSANRFRENRQDWTNPGDRRTLPSDNDPLSAEGTQDLPSQEMQTDEWLHLVDERSSVERERDVSGP
jgi:hypothetical protein